MTFPCLRAGRVARETHHALLFQRTMILDALLDAREARLPVPDRVLAEEGLAILRAKHRFVRGEWSYVPEVEELPPDADDLAVVVSVLHRLGGPDLASTCDEAIRLVLDAARPDGGFLTWVLDPRGRAAADQRVDAYLLVVNGWGVHPEGVANLTAALIRYNPHRFREPPPDVVPYADTKDAYC
ncbi:MAG: hypothetical protein AUI36_37925 [Cyanobacteria bacterium 13_1_40CM_2_61_4]|nr:MAG: hypothetical protein AUI36_37925 [Cyanobacteria bacterium 13_1_40CM_2_61_4]